MSTLVWTAANAPGIGRTRADSPALKQTSGLGALQVQSGQSAVALALLDAGVGGVRRPIDRVLAVVRRWQTGLGQALGCLADWPEDATLPYWTDKPDWDGYGGLLLLAAYDERPDLRPDRLDSPGRQPVSDQPGRTKKHRLTRPRRRNHSVYGASIAPHPAGPTGAYTE